MENKVNGDDTVAAEQVINQMANIILEHEKKIAVLDHRLSILEKAAEDRRIVVLS